MDEDFPAVCTMGIKDLEHGMRRARAELASGAVVHLVSKTSGRHRAWIVPEVDPGYQVEQVTVTEFKAHVSTLLELVEQNGIALEVYDQRAGQTAFYVSWCPPEALAARPECLQFYVRSKLGRALLREFASPVAARVRAS